MAVAFDSTFEKGFGGGATTVSFISSTGTVGGSVGAGANRVLIGALGSSDIQSAMGTVTMSWNGSSMTQIVAADAGASESIYLFGQIAPASGANVILASWTGAVVPDTALGAISFTGADQTTGWQNSGTDTGAASPSSSVVTTANGNAAVVATTNDNGTGTAISSGTQAWLEGALDGNYGMAYALSTTVTAVISWTYGGAHGFGNVKVDVIAAGSGAQYIPPKIIPQYNTTIVNQ